jgi:hypothetical protein
MHWKTIRLELASTPEFPAGSAGRAYLLRLPIDDCGILDAAALGQRPDHATVRRFWPSEPDWSGHVERTASGWRLRCSGETSAEAVSLIDEQPIRLGGEVIVTEADGRRLPFRVTDIKPLC